MRSGNNMSQGAVAANIGATISTTSKKDHDGKERAFDSSPSLEELVGKHIVYKYDNGWEYEAYYKNESTIDYRVRSGKLAGRCVKGQAVHIRRLLQLAEAETESPPPRKMFMVSWTEPTGTCVTQVVDLDNASMESAAFFPHWVIADPHKSVGFQNPQKLSAIASYRDLGPTYPLHVVNMRGLIHTLLDHGPNDDLLIS